MSTKSIVFLSALIPVGLVITNRLGPGKGIAIAVVLLVIANLIPDMPQGAA